ncbi:MAG: hypothetical protein HDT44_02720 [Ruminococcaceae bacterium]|nr:hypothetical protein [Oscillospiraceae bacterium]
MEPSKLSEHIFKKGKFITPLNNIPNTKECSDEKSWIYGRMPEYLWIGLILKFFGRKTGFEKLNDIISKLHNLAPTLETVRLSQILKLDVITQKQLYNYIVSIGVKEALTPLTAFLTISYAPVFAEIFYCAELSIESRCNTLTDTMKEIMDHQSNESTDIRYVALYFYLLSGKMQIQESQAGIITLYPNSSHDNEIMRLARPMIRSMEMMILSIEAPDSKYINDFWRCVSEMTDCNILSFNFPEENRNVTAYMEKLRNVFAFLLDLFLSIDPLDDKMNVLLGIATYSYKRLQEVYDHSLFNTISGRSCVRVLIEDYIMMKYLVKNESSHENIWRDYQIYGTGLYKLVLARHRQAENVQSDDCHFDAEYIEMLVNEFKYEAFIDMDTKYFDSQGIREKAKSVGEKDLYGLYYDYDSSFEHGLWGAIRESSMLKCANPAHKYHCIPDIKGEINLKSVWSDCVMVMNKTLIYLNELYGIPEQILNEVINFEFNTTSE